MTKAQQEQLQQSRERGQFLENGVRKGVTKSLSLNRVLKSTQWKRRAKGFKSEQSKGGLLPIHWSRREKNVKTDRGREHTQSPCTVARWTLNAGTVAFPTRWYESSEPWLCPPLTGRPLTPYSQQLAQNFSSISASRTTHVSPWSHVSCAWIICGFGSKPNKCSLTSVITAASGV